MKPADATSDAFQASFPENEQQMHFQRAPHAPEPAAADDLLRCVCGALLARWTAAGLELKCRRCKRTTLIPYPKRTAVTRRRPT
ncbi:MAG: hypothetical protein WDO69_18205 [Pseudomonadota bacterium]